MTGYLVSLLTGLAVGVAYGLVQVHSPAPLLVALVGLLGIVLREKVMDTVKGTLVPPTLSSAADKRAENSDAKQFVVSKESQNI
jgi:XapX domain-containing protein